ncbi:MAG: M56 family metallopeptidase [Muribaculaceae bacterium]|nr:M56 family metallopeptidase [Muribaculaceae bacterium]
MASFFAYTVYSGIFLLAFYLVFKWFMASEKQSRLNRAVLLGVYLVSFAIFPLSLLFHVGHVPGEVSFDAPEFAGVATGAADAGSDVWAFVLLAVYMAGAAAVAIWTVTVAVKIASLIRHGHRENRGEYTLVLLQAGVVAPFSWGRYVVMGTDDYALAGDVIIEHELGHLRGYHFIDMLLAQTVCVMCWYNPAAWLLREELKSVHEFEADEHVLASGVEARTYQMLLIKKAVGLRFQSLANSLNHSKLKKRITMMYNQKSTGIRRLRGLALVPALAVALVAVNNPSFASALGSLRDAVPEKSAEKSGSTVISETVVVGYGTPARSDGKVTKKEQAAKTSAVVEPKVDKIAMFPGGEAEMYRFLAMNIKYPAEAVKAGTQGRVVVSFNVLADGTVSDVKVAQSVSPELDAEAVRVAKAMPKWTPAEVDGKPVATTYAFPVAFRLQGDDKPAKK